MKKKKSLCSYFKRFNADFISYICYQAPGSTRLRARLMASSAGYIPGEGLNFSFFVLNRILELSRKCFKRTRKHLASGIFATRELKTPRQRGQRERQKNIRLNRQKNNSVFVHFDFFGRLCTTTTNYYDVRRKNIFVFLILDMVLSNSAPEELACIKIIKRAGIIAIEIEKLGIQYLRDVFVSFAVLAILNSLLSPP